MDFATAATTISTTTKTIPHNNQPKNQQQWQQLLYSTCNSESKTVIGSSAPRVFWNTEQTKALVYAWKQNLKVMESHQSILAWNMIENHPNKHGSNNAVDYVEKKT